MDRRPALGSRGEPEKPRHRLAERIRLRIAAASCGGLTLRRRGHTLRIDNQPARVFPESGGKRAARRAPVKEWRLLAGEPRERQCGCSPGEGKAVKFGHGPATVIGRRCWSARDAHWFRMTRSTGQAGKGRSFREGAKQRLHSTAGAPVFWDAALGRPSARKPARVVDR